MEITLEVDTEKNLIGDFIGTLSRRVSFSDISIKALPMEEIIAQIYGE